MRNRLLIPGKIGHGHGLAEGRPAGWLPEFARRGASCERKGGQTRRKHPHACLLLLAAFLFQTILMPHARAQRVAPDAPFPSPPARPVPSGKPVPLSLVEAVALGLRDNRGIKSAYLERVAQKFDLVVAESLFRPRIDLAADLVRQRVGGITSTDLAMTPSISWLAPTGASAGLVWDRRQRLDGGSRALSDTTSFSISQPLLRGAGFDVTLAPVRIARLQEQINHLRLKSTVSDTVTAIIFAYRDLLRAQQQVQLAQLSLERTQSLLDTNRALIAAGRMAAADIVQTESGLANQEVAVLQARQQKASAQLSLLQLLAVDPRTNIVAGDPIRAEQMSIDLDAVIDLGLSSRMDILAQRKALEQDRQALIVARNNRLWNLSVTGSISRQRGNDALLGQTDPRTDHAVGLQLDIPIGDPSLRQREIQATTTIRTAELRYQDLCQSVETQIRDAAQTVEANWQQLEAARRARNLAAKALELEQEKLKVGRASNFEVLSFQTDLRAADTQELTASITYLNALTALDQQIGNTLDTWRIDLND